MKVSMKELLTEWRKVFKESRLDDTLVPDTLVEPEIEMGDFPVDDRSQGVSIDDLAHGVGDYAPSADSGGRSEIEPQMLEAFIEKMVYEQMTAEEFMNYFGNQDGYMYHGAHWESLKGEYLEALRNA